MAISENHLGEIENTSNGGGLAFNDNVNVPQLYGALRATINELSNRRSTATGLAPVELFDSKEPQANARNTEQTPQADSIAPAADNTNPPGDRIVPPEASDRVAPPIVSDATSTWLREQMARTPDLSRGDLQSQGWSTRVWRNADGSYIELELSQGGTLARLSWLTPSGERGEGYLRQLPNGQQMVNMDRPSGGYQISASNEGWEPGGFQANELHTVLPDNSRSSKYLSPENARQRIADFRALLPGLPDAGSLPESAGTPTRVDLTLPRTLGRLSAASPTQEFGSPELGFSKRIWEAPDGYQEIYTRGNNIRLVSADATGRREFYLRQHSTGARMLNVSAPDGTYVVVTGSQAFGEFQANTIRTVRPDGTYTTAPMPNADQAIQDFITAMRRIRPGNPSS